MVKISPSELSIDGDLSLPRYSTESTESEPSNISDIPKPKESKGLPLLFRANDVPKWPTAILLAFQQTMVCMPGLFVFPYIISDNACAGLASTALRAQLISTTFIITGIATILQTTLGLRLAILQGPSFAFLGPLYAFVKLPENKCTYNTTDVVPEQEYYGRIQIIQGSLICASFFFMLLGATGFIGVISGRVGPITICPLVLLLCLDNVGAALDKAKLHWISMVQFAFLCLFALILAELGVPLPYYKKKKIRWTKYRLLGQFPYLLAIVVTYIFALILSKTGLEPPEGPARVDKRQAMDVLVKSAWVQIPYPAQFGAFQFSLGLFLGMCAACVAAATESLGAYGVLSKLSQENPPKPSTLNRAILIEGIGVFCSGILGACVGITTYSENVALVNVTRVASRFTMQLAGCILVLLGLFTKFGAVIATIPDPMVGGILAMSFCMVSGVGIANLQTVDLRLSRNITIMGVAIILGTMIPDYFAQNPVNTGNYEVDQMLNILLNIKMLIGGFIAFILDNLVTGATKEQRGFVGHFPTYSEDKNDISLKDGYAFPDVVNRFLLKCNMLTKLPFFPSEKLLKEQLGIVNEKNIEMSNGYH